MEQIRNRFRQLTQLLGYSGLLLAGAIILAGLLVGIIYRVAPGSAYVATYVLWLVIVNVGLGFIIGATSPKIKLMMVTTALVLVLLGYGYYGLLYFGLVL